MRKTIQSVCIALIGYSGPILANSGTPTFNECSITVSTVQKRGHLKFPTIESRRYASQLKLAARQPVNFSGHYVLATWGCGSGCVMGAAIDARTGWVTMLPFTVSDWPLDVAEPISFRKNSCLLIVQGSRNEQGHGTYYYRFSGRRFDLDKAVEP